MSSMLSAPAIIPATRHADLQVRVHPARPADPDMLRGQVRQARPLRQGHHRDQARPRHEIRVIKRRIDLRQTVQQCRVAPVRFRSRGPLRTVRASRPGTRLKQAARAFQD